MALTGGGAVLLVAAVPTIRLPVTHPALVDTLVPTGTRVFVGGASRSGAVHLVRSVYAVISTVTHFGGRDAFWLVFGTVELFRTTGFYGN